MRIIYPQRKSSKKNLSVFEQRLNARLCQVTMASEFISDTWNGHQFFRSILRWSPVFVDWVSFLAFMGIPLIVMITQLFYSGTFWEATALAWFGCVAVYFCFFSFAVFVFEILGAVELLSHHPDYELLDLERSSVKAFIKRAVLLRMKHAYSGVRTRTFFVEGAQALPTANESYEDTENVDTEYVVTTVALFTRITKWLPDKYFYEYNPPKRQVCVAPPVFPRDHLSRSSHFHRFTSLILKMF